MRFFLKLFFGSLMCRRNLKQLFLQRITGRVITSDWAIPKYKFSEGIEAPKQETPQTEDLPDTENDAETITTPIAAGGALSKNEMKRQQKKKERKERDKLKNIQKRARIIVRNLSFNVRFLPFYSSEFSN